MPPHFHGIHFNLIRFLNSYCSCSRWNHVYCHMDGLLNMPLPSTYSLTSPQWFLEDLICHQLGDHRVSGCRWHCMAVISATYVLPQGT